MNMKRMVVAMGIAAVALEGAADAKPTYSLGNPDVPIVCNVTSYSQYATQELRLWAISNACYAGSSAAYFRGSNMGSNLVDVVNEKKGDLPAYSLEGALAGFPAERNKPQCYLGDTLSAPDGVDWNATYDNWATNKVMQRHFVVDVRNARVYVVEGGLATFTWMLVGGTSADVVINISPVGAGRPKNIFWTDETYGGKPVDLTNKHPVLCGPTNLLERSTGLRGTGEFVNGVEVSNRVVTSGVYLNGSSLCAAGELEGQFVLVYYDSALHERIVDVLVVEVTRPRTEVVYGATVGQMLQPSGRGYDISGLVANPVTLSEPDSYGPYLYQHQGTYGYSPKHKAVFALRPTDDKTRNQTQIHWAEVDNQGVSWPFEIDEYIVRWPEDISIFVRTGNKNAPGKGIEIPTDYQCELQKYQEGEDGLPQFHASAAADGVFSSYAPGKCLLKLAASDNVWFVPIQSVLRTDTTWFTLEPQTATVGERIFARGGSVAGLAKGRNVPLTAGAPGWIYEPNSDRIWNPDLYSADGKGWMGCPSEVYPVTAPMVESVTNRLEVWWSSVFQDADMPTPLTIPSVPQVTEVVWPDEFELPEIALASQEGSAGYSRYCDGAALAFDAADSSLALPSRILFSAEGGTVALWTKAPDGAAGESRLLTLGADKDKAGQPLLTVSIANGVAVARFSNGSVLRCDVPAAPDRWAHIALSWSEATNVLSVVAWDRTNTVAQAGLETEMRLKLAGSLGGNTVGADAHGGTVERLRYVDEITCWSECLTAQAAHERGSSRLGGGEWNLSLYVPFRGVDELLANGSGVRTATDLVEGTTLTATSALRATPGAPVIECAVIDSDERAVVYRQADPNATGFNPNEEHAFVDAGAGGYVAWALRCDLNGAGREMLSPPLTLVEYVKDGAARMARFHVVATNIFYTTLGADCEAGLALPGPKPLTLLPDPWLKEDYWRNGGYPEDERTQPYRDRKGQLWARAKGKFDIYMYYAQQGGFDWPAGIRAPEIGAAVPWLAYLDGGDGKTPRKWAWNVRWPENTAVMKIGQTLTDAADGLPEMWNAKSMAVIYPVRDVDVANPEETVVLADPTCSQVEKLGCPVSALAVIGLTTEPGGKLVNSKGLYYFRDVSPSLANCLFLDPSNDTLVMRGYREEKQAGTPLLFLNVLTETNKWDVLSLVKGYEKEDAYKALAFALDNLVRRGAKKPTATRAVTKGTGAEIVSDYQPVDHYALTAMGAPTYVSNRPTYVVVIENDATNDWCDAGNPINMHIFTVTNEYYTGRALTRQDPLNLLSQVLDVTCTETFAGQAGDYVFDWRWAKPDALGNVPDDFGKWTSKFAGGAAIGRTSFTVGGQGDTLANMVNTYWTCRYRAWNPESAAGKSMGTNTWSAWYSPPALAEGWIQRVLNNVTPFNQRMTDLYENPAETKVTMLQEAGKPYAGDVALNQDNLTSVGLIELYRTLLNKAETMSLRLGVKDAGANQQLLLAVERLHDLYRVLGDEAYADAANPTIGFGSQFIADRVTLDYGAASGALFCFDNQVPTLLDEELALIRGRSCVNAPGNTVAPFYNRLVWNFTKGITAGEVAYAVNYDISGAKASVLDEETAAKLYPQGHGDAYGHYLSALQGWYRLLRNPNFDWGQPSMSALNVADTVVNADYYEEAKFAEAAAAAARTAKRAVELTALKHWRDRGADTVGGGYVDANPTNAFGYGEWAARGAFGALCNWAVANSLLPDAVNTNGQGVAYADKGLLRIDRGTVAGIGEIASAAESIQRTEDRMDAGMNPLGFNENAVPFDLTPIGSAADATHYEQVRERAATAFANAKAILDRAQEYANRLRLIDEERTGAVDRSDALEDDYTAQLVAIYGRPYADDVGAGKTYPEGYTGPDLYHYMWVNNLSDYGLDGVANTNGVTTYSYAITGYTKNGEIVSVLPKPSVLASSDDIPPEITSSAASTLTYTLSPNGVVVKNAGVTGTRPANGELQQAYADFLVAYGAVQNALRAYERQQDHLGVKIDLALAQTAASDKLGKVEDQVYKGDKQNWTIARWIEELRRVKISASVFAGAADGWQVWIITDSNSNNEFGLAASKGSVAMCIAYDAIRMTQASLEARAATDEATIATMEKMLDEADRDYATATTNVGLWDGLEEAVMAVSAAASALNAAWREMNAAQVQFSALVQKGESIREARELARQQIVNSVSKMRYNDMFFRQLRNDALAKYDAAFDLAKTYAFLAAKAYGYETGAMPEDLVREIVAARALGETDNAGNPIVSGHGDAGLAGALAKMDANWRTLRTQLGFNNPQGYATWFSLRHELFRILRGKLGDAAWKTELAKHWTDDIRSNPDFLRHCQPFVSRFGLADKEPGLVFTFETTIDFALNLFGRPLAYDDSQFDSSWFATKIASAGVWFENYNERTADYKGQETVFAATPNVYLVPVGTDRMRVPGTDGEAVADFTVLDQTVPVPYPVTAAELAEAMWLPSFLQGEYAGVDTATRIRRHPSFRAYYGAEGTKPSDGQLDAVRLTGRSVWNTKWMLVIPAGTLNSNREKALRAFIDGMDVDGDGKLDVKGVSDIRIGFKTYSYGGK